MVTMGTVLVVTYSLPGEGNVAAKQPDEVYLLR
jgi:hypothetical protein